MKARVLLACLVAAAWLVAPGVHVYAQAPPCASVSAPMCDGECPPGDSCLDMGGTCGCVPDPAPCGAIGGPPLCWGACPPLDACVDVGGICTCLPIPTLSEWGIIFMSVVMLGGVIFLRRRSRRSI